MLDSIHHMALKTFEITFAIFTRFYYGRQYITLSKSINH